MPKIVLVSTEVLWDESKQTPYANVVESLQKIADANNVVALVSAHPQPPWLAQFFPKVVFCSCRFDERRNGLVIDRLLDQNKKLGLKYSDMVVLGAKNDDFFMAVLKQVLFIRCDWAQAEERDRAEKYGIPLSDPLLLPRMMRLLESNTSWFYQHKSAVQSLYALTNAGTLSATGMSVPARNLVDGLRSCLKQGDQQRKLAFQVHLLSSLYVTDDFREVDVWSYYPGSHSANDGSEVMAGFCDLARTAYRCRTKGPLFIRHSACPSRHGQGSNADRTDPAEQVATVHLNPAYRAKLRNATVAVLDDFLSWGVSFGVATALLQAAGAKKIHCVSMGKFGRQTRTYSLQIEGDPFKPVTKYEYGGCVGPVGNHTGQAQLEFVGKFTAN